MCKCLSIYSVCSGKESVTQITRHNQNFEYYSCCSHSSRPHWRNLGTAFAKQLSRSCILSSGQMMQRSYSLPLVLLFNMVWNQSVSKTFQFLFSPSDSFFIAAQHSHWVSDLGWMAYNNLMYPMTYLIQVPWCIFAVLWALVQVTFDTCGYASLSHMWGHHEDLSQSNNPNLPLESVRTTFHLISPQWEHSKT